MKKISKFRSIGSTLSHLFLWLLILTLPASVEVRATEPVNLQVRLLDEQGITLQTCEAYWIYGSRFKNIMPTQGAFEIPRSGGVIVVRSEAGGYGGLIVDSAGPPSQDIQIVDWQSGRKYATRPALNTDLRDNLLDQLRKICWQQIESGNSGDLKPFLLETLGTLDPNNTRRYLAEHSLKGVAAAMAQRSLVSQIVKSDFSRAVDIVDAVADSRMRVELLAELVAHLPSDAPEAIEIEAQWASAIRELKQPALRLAQWANLGEYYLLRGRADQVEKIVQQSLSEVQKLPSGGWSGLPRSMFAALVAPRDPDLALKLISGIDADEKARAEGRVAFYACQAQREFALEVATAIDNGNIIGFPYRTKVAHRMATYHPAAARRVAESIPDLKHRAWALGMISEQMANPESAKAALQEAYNRIGEASDEKVRTYVSPSEIAVGLLPLAESKCNEQLEALIWKSIWTAVPRTRWNDGGKSVKEMLENVAAGIARYDLKLARALVDGPEGVHLSDKLSPRSVKNRLAVAPDSVSTLLNENQLAPRNYRELEILTKLLVERDTTSYWDQISLPDILEWPTARYEER